MLAEDFTPQEVLRQVAALKGEWNEDDHPRDDHGRFASGEGGGSAVGTVSVGSIEPHARALTGFGSATDEWLVYTQQQEIRYAAESMLGQDHPTAVESFRELHARTPVLDALREGKLPAGDAAAVGKLTDQPSEPRDALPLRNEVQSAVDNAYTLLQGVRDAEPQEQAFRGVALFDQDPGSATLRGLQVGDTFDIGLASFTSDRVTAETFTDAYAQGAGQGGRSGTGQGMLLELEPGFKGVPNPMTEISILTRTGSAKGYDDIVTSGRFEVVGRSMSGYSLSIRQVGVFDPDSSGALIRNAKAATAYRRAPFWYLFDGTASPRRQKSPLPYGTPRDVLEAVARLKEWDESLHPRDEHGRFGSGDSSGPDTSKLPPIALPTPDKENNGVTPGTWERIAELQGEREALLESGGDPAKLDAKVNALFDQERAEQRDYRHTVEEGIARGQITAEEAEKTYGVYNFRGGDWVKLPDTMYHVTTAASAVAETGRLMTRDELQQQGMGTGLGGGASDTISFTSDREMAGRIEEAMHEAHDYLSGKTSGQDLLDAASRGDRSDRPWAADMINGYYGHGGVNFERTGWQAGDPIPDNVARAFNSDDPIIRMGAFEVWSSYREYAGGPTDPLFFGTDARALAAMDPKDIAVLTVTPRVENGIQMSALGEYRVISGDHVAITGGLPGQKSIGRKEYDESQHPRDEAGRWTSGAGGATTTAQQPSIGGLTIDKGQQDFGERQAEARQKLFPYSGNGEALKRQAADAIAQRLSHVPVEKLAAAANIPLLGTVLKDRDPGQVVIEFKDGHAVTFGGLDRLHEKLGASGDVFNAMPERNFGQGQGLVANARADERGAFDAMRQICEQVYGADERVPQIRSFAWGDERERVDAIASRVATGALIHTWAASSNDDYPTSLCMQRAVEDEFHVRDATQWQSRESTQSIVDQRYEEHGDVFRSFARAMYDETQDRLHAAGYRAGDTIPISRGMSWNTSERYGLIHPEEPGPSRELLDGWRNAVKPEPSRGEPAWSYGFPRGAGSTTTTMSLRPASSVSIDDDQAVQFAESHGNRAGAVVRTDVPIERVLAMPGGGFGCASESEMVILGGKTDVHVTYANATNWDVLVGRETVGAKASLLDGVSDLVRNEDWLRTRAWDLPTDPVALDEMGITPQDLRGLPCMEVAPTAIARWVGMKSAKFADDQPRDEQGRWTSGGGGELHQSETITQTGFLGGDVPRPVTNLVTDEQFRSEIGARLPRAEVVLSQPVSQDELHAVTRGLDNVLEQYPHVANDVARFEATSLRNIFGKNPAGSTRFEGGGASMRIDVGMHREMAGLTAQQESLDQTTHNYAVSLTGISAWTAAHESGGPDPVQSSIEATTTHEMFHVVDAHVGIEEHFNEVGPRASVGAHMRDMLADTRPSARGVMYPELSDREAMRPSPYGAGRLSLYGPNPCEFYAESMTAHALGMTGREPASMRDLLATTDRGTQMELRWSDTKVRPPADFTKEVGPWVDFTPGYEPWEPYPFVGDIAPFKKSYDESAHPRDEQGRWTAGDGGSGTTTPGPVSSGWIRADGTYTDVTIDAGGHGEGAREFAAGDVRFHRTETEANVMWQRDLTHGQLKVIESSLTRHPVPRVYVDHTVRAWERLGGVRAERTTMEGVHLTTSLDGDHGYVEGDVRTQMALLHTYVNPYTSKSVKYDEVQHPRDEHGRWTSGGSEATATASPRDLMRAAQERLAERPHIAHPPTLDTVQRYEKLSDVRPAPGFQQRLGNCYEESARFVIANQDCTLVHGAIEEQKLPGTDVRAEPIAHSWVEYPTGVIHDAVLGRDFHPDDYHTFFNPTEFARYSAEETMVNMVKSGHWGPWDETSNWVAG